MSCLECKHWNLRDRREMSRQGFGLCNDGPVWEFKPPQYRCNSFAADDGDKILKRIEWLRKIGRFTDDR